MAKNPGRMYRKIMQHAYTRREYMGGVPGNRIIQFESGIATGDFPIRLTLIAEERGQIRHTALEAMRQTAVRALDAGIGRENYHLQVRVYPHHVLRQNKQASGAGADRVSMGMRLAFGKAIGTAARVEAGQPILQVRVTVKGVAAAKEAFRKAYNKVATPCHIDIEGLDLGALGNIEAGAAPRKPAKPAKAPADEAAPAAAAATA
ncbi:MAG: large subunit ribosomal protein L10e [Thermoplasmata archaeon]|jgi:large subunit ribosomal protein L10e|nr:large subunit ribosomal protein L10e [Thermoplasmata archaeon]